MPLDNSIWYSILFISAITTAALYALFIFERKYYNGTERSPITSALIEIVGILADQGSTSIFYSLPARIILLTTVTMSFMVNQYYTSSVVGSLLTPTPKTITNCEQLTKSKLKLIFEPTPTLKTTFQLNSNQVVKKLYETKIAGQEQFVPVSEAIKLVRRGGYAYFTFIDYFYDLIRKSFDPKELDDLTQVSVYETNAATSYLYFPIQKYSPFKEPFRVAICRMLDTGIADYWNKYWSSEKPVGDLNSFKFVFLDMKMISSIFYFLIFGMVGSLAILGAEIFYNKTKHNNVVRNLVKKNRMIL